MALVRWNGSQIGLPGIGEQRAGALLVEPFDFALPHRENAAQDKLVHPLPMGLRIGQGQRRSPRAAQNLPAFNAEMGAQRLHVGHQMPGRILPQFRIGRGLPAAPLVEKNDAVALGIMQAPQERRYAASGSAMQDDDGLALRVSAFLEIDFVAGLKREAFRGNRAAVPERIAACQSV